MYLGDIIRIAFVFLVVLLCSSVTVYIVINNEAKKIIKKMGW